MLSDGEGIVRPELLKLCTAPSKTNPAYGLTWWLKNPVPPEIARGIPLLQRDMKSILAADWLSNDFYMAAGAGKNRLYVLPTLKLVVVRQGMLLQSQRGYEDATFLSLLLRGHE